MTAPLPAGCNQLGPDFAAMLRSVALLNVRRAFGGPLVEGRDARRHPQSMSPLTGPSDVVGSPTSL